MADKKPTLKRQRPKLPEDLTATLGEVADRELRGLSPHDIVNASAIDAEEEKSLDREAVELDNQRLRDELARAKEMHTERKDYTNRLFWLIVWWLVAVVLFMFLCGACDGFLLSDKVLIAFITSTTISVLGLFVIVAKWLFPAGADAQNRDRNRKPKNGDAKG